MPVSLVGLMQLLVCDERPRNEARRSSEQGTRPNVSARDAEPNRMRGRAPAAEAATQKRLAATERKAKRERLKVLDEQAKALDDRADALTLTDEAQRLREAAAAVKASRKGSET